VTKHCIRISYASKYLVKLQPLSIRAGDVKVFASVFPELQEHRAFLYYIKACILYSGKS
jgi:hypothetical protein